MRFFFIFTIAFAFIRYGRCGGIFDFADTNFLDFGFFPNTIQLIRQCGKSDLFLCLKEKTLSYVDNVSSRDYKIFDGLYLKLTKEPKTIHAPNNETLPDEPTSRSQRIDELLMERFLSFLKTRSLEIRAPESTINSIEQTVEEGRKKKKKELIPIIMMMKMKAVAALHLVMGLIAAMSLKAIIMAKIALVISAAIGLKKLLSHSESRSLKSGPDDFFTEIFSLWQNDKQDSGHSLAYSAYQ